MKKKDEILEMNNSLIKSIISTDYSDIERESHIEEILSCHSTIDEATSESLHFDRDNFNSVLDSYLKKKHEDLKKNSSCVCFNPIFKSESTLIEYFIACDHIEKYLCENCGYVSPETTNRQMTTY